MLPSCVLGTMYGSFGLTGLEIQCWRRGCGGVQTLLSGITRVTVKFFRATKAISKHILESARRGWV